MGVNLNSNFEELWLMYWSLIRKIGWKKAENDHTPAFYANFFNYSKLPFLQITQAILPIKIYALLVVWYALAWTKKKTYNNQERSKCAHVYVLKISTLNSFIIEIEVLIKKLTLYLLLYYIV